MKLLLDENLSIPSVPFLLEAFPEATQVVLLGLENANDKVIWQYAKNNGFVLVIKDADFYDMVTVYGQPRKVIWLKIGNQSKAATINALVSNQREIEQVLMSDDKACIAIYS